MKRIRDIRESSRIEQKAKGAAKCFFEREFPNDRVCWVNIAERADNYLVVGISYGTASVPPPYRFFRVSLPSFTVTQLSKEYWPHGWGAYR